MFRSTIRGAIRLSPRQYARHYYQSPRVPICFPSSSRANPFDNNRARPRFCSSSATMDPQTTASGSQPPLRPPYQHVEGFEKRLEGSCHCGRVKYWLKRDKPLDAKYCHCHGCQVLHGAPFQWAAIFHKDDMMFENGMENLAFYQSGKQVLGHDLPCKVSCTYCRTPIFDEGRRMVLLFPTLLKFEDKKARDLFYPECHIFYSQRCVDIPDGKPKWDGLDADKSLLLDDLP
jgi:hypothetical protein